MDAFHKVSKFGDHVIMLDNDDYHLVLNALEEIIIDMEQSYNHGEGYFATISEMKRLKSELER